MFKYLRLAVVLLLISHGAQAMMVPAAKLDTQPDEKPQSIVLAGGCFWGVQGVFQHVKGVTSAVSGYAGGTATTAHYEIVSTGTTGHAESVQVTFDPSQVSLGQILQIYFSAAHDPTEIDRQGPDTGPQYRSAVFTTSPQQLKIVQAYIEQLSTSHSFKKSIVTTAQPLKAFYPAEDYHQNYYQQHPDNPYIYVNDRPKVEELKRDYPQLYTEPKS